MIKGLTVKVTQGVGKSQDHVTPPHTYTAIARDLKRWRMVK